MTIEIDIYGNNYTITPKKTFKLPENEKITGIRIRPNEIAVITKEVFSNGDTQTRLHLFKQEILSFEKVELK